MTFGRVMFRKKSYIFLMKVCESLPLLMTRWYKLKNMFTKVSCTTRLMSRLEQTLMRELGNHVFCVFDKATRCWYA